SITASIDDANLTKAAGGVWIDTVQTAAAGGPAYDLYTVWENGPMLNAGYNQLVKRRFRLGSGGTWSAWVDNYSEAAMKTALQSLVDPGDVALVEIKGSIAGDNFETRFAGVSLPAGYGALECEFDQPTNVNTDVTSVATNSRAAMHLVHAPNADNKIRLAGNWDRPPQGEIHDWGTMEFADKASLMTQLNAQIGAGNYVLHHPGFTPLEIRQFTITMAGEWSDRKAFIVWGSTTANVVADVKPIQSGTPPRNQIDRITWSGSPEFTLAVNGSETATVGLPITAQAVEAALYGLNGVDNATVTTPEPGAIEVEWINDFRGLDVIFTLGTLFDSGDSSAEVQIIQAGAPPQNCKQRIVVDANATAGTLAATIDGVHWSDPFAFDATLATVQAAFDAEYAGQTSITGPTAGPWIVEFIGSYSGLTLGLMLLDQSQLEAGNSLMKITELSAGEGPHRWDTAKNWSLGVVPDTHKIAYLAEGDMAISAGYVQAAEFTATVGSNKLQVGKGVHLLAGMRIRFRSTDTLPAPLLPDTDYTISAISRVKGTINVGPPVTDLGRGAHTIEVALAGFWHDMR
ncbi:MAG: hypothetical protein ACK5Q5_16500, partial [Planctomycetaceae bacterium]